MTARATTVFTTTGATTVCATSGTATVCATSGTATVCATAGTATVRTTTGATTIRTATGATVRTAVGATTIRTTTGATTIRTTTATEVGTAVGADATVGFVSGRGVATVEGGGAADVKRRGAIGSEGRGAVGIKRRSTTGINEGGGVHSVVRHGRRCGHGHERGGAEQCCGSQTYGTHSEPSRQKYPLSMGTLGSAPERSDPGAAERTSPAALRTGSRSVTGEEFRHEGVAELPCRVQLLS
ncbi:hypothetical protein ACIPWY_19640 [Streptomyces sp. NPDC090032]|uniref:hypothetical protein n=1 Tax=Streptomyces sp. NPDC090032 TaxID=3365925 RepID=UPI003800F44D